MWCFGGGGLLAGSSDLCWGCVYSVRFVFGITQHETNVSSKQRSVRLQWVRVCDHGSNFHCSGCRSPPLAPITRPHPCVFLWSPLDALHLRGLYHAGLHAPVGFRTFVSSLANALFCVAVPRARRLAAAPVLMVVCVPLIAPHVCFSWLAPRP